MEAAALVTERPAEGLTVSQVHAFYREVLDLPYEVPHSDEPYRGRGRVALASGELIGVLTGGLLPDNDSPEQRFLYLYGAVHPSWRRQGIGRRLLAGLVEDIRGEDRPVTLVATLDRSPAEPAALFLLQQGFSEIPGSVRYERDLASASPAQGEEPSRPISIYRGGDAGLDSAIVDLYHRAYRGRTAIPQLTIEDVRRQTEIPGFAYFLAFDGDRLVGHAAVHVHEAECYVDSIVVVRSHWGSGASDAIGQAITRHALAQACTRIACVAEIRNRASRALIERQGYAPAGQLRRFVRDGVLLSGFRDAVVGRCP